MSIYRRGFNFDFAWAKGKPWALILVIIVAVLIVAGGYVIITSLEQPPMQIHLLEDEIKAGEHTLVNIVIFNNTQGDFHDVELYVNVADREAIDVAFVQTGTSTITIPVLEKEGGKREIDVLVNPRESVLPGNYTIYLEAVMDEKVYSEEVNIEIVK